MTTTITRQINMEISNFKLKANSSLIATFDLTLTKWGNFIIGEMTLFQKDNHKWIGFPSRKFESEGKTKYFAYNAFKERSMQDAFSKQVVALCEAELAKSNANPAIPNDGPINEVPF
jgi:hypothetical protein